MIELIDTHCHIQSVSSLTGEKVTTKLWQKLKDRDVNQVIADAKSAGVNRLIVVGCNLEDSCLAIELAKKHNNIWASIGIHPHEAKDYVSKPKFKEHFAQLLDEDKVVAVGECGLDYFYEHSDPLSQRQILEFQLGLAKTHNLPVIFHVREAFDDFWPILKAFKDIRGVLHSFTDNSTNLDIAIRRGLFIGVNGIATFTKEPTQTAMYKAIPDKNLLLETDSPFLTPVPLRGKINEPKNVRLVAEYLASLKGQSLQTLSSQTTMNARKLFGL